MSDGWQVSDAGCGVEQTEFGNTSVQERRFHSVCLAYVLSAPEVTEMQQVLC